MSEAALAPTRDASPRSDDAPPPRSGGALRVVRDSPPPGRPRAIPRLEVPPYDLETALKLERELAVSHTLAQILVRRGFATARSAREFLQPSEIHPPSAFRGIDSAIEVIKRHLRARSRITIHGDYDVDGVCATAVMVRALRALGGEVDWFLPGRVEDGYGLSLDTVSRLAARGTNLLITVDCAITAIDQVARAQKAGLEVVVTDHHAPRADGALPQCSIVHPAVAGYPCEELCGTGVAYKLAQALDAPTAAEDVELVALATVADLMPLRGENRRLVRDGLRVLARTTKPGLVALMSVTRCDPSALDAGVLGFRLGPRINAAGRLRRADAGLELLLTEDPRRAEEIANELEEVNLERRAVEERIGWEAEAQIAELGDRFSFVIEGEGWHPGVIGIVASRVAERFHRPAILLSGDGAGLVRGSGRSIPGFDLLEALHHAADHLESYGGHRAAAGLTVRAERVDELRGAVERHARAVLRPELLAPRERIDAVVSGSSLGLDLAEELESLEPCGLGNPRGSLLIPGARFDDLRPMGEGRHARFSVRSGGTRARAVAFGCNGRLQDEPGEPVDATFRLERNFWNGAVEPRLILRHALPCRRGKIDVLGEPDDYLGSVLEELRAPIAPWRERASADGGLAGVGRTVLDRRDEGLLATLADALSAGCRVLAVCADVPRRLAGLSDRVGGFALISYHALERGPESVAAFAQLVALDPPPSPFAASLLGQGRGHTHLAWGEAELRFALQMHELEYGLRTSLVALYRGLRLRRRVAGEELEHLLRGEGPHGRPARLGARLIRILAELELVSLDQQLAALELAGTARVELEHSPSYRAYAQRYEDGRRYLSSANLQPNG